MMFGYACRETDDYMPLAIVHRTFCLELAKIAAREADDLAAPIPKPGYH